MGNGIYSVARIVWDHPDVQDAVSFCSVGDPRVYRMACAPQRKMFKYILEGKDDLLGIHPDTPAEILFSGHAILGHVAAEQVDLHEIYASVEEMLYSLRTEGSSKDAGPASRRRGAGGDGGGGGGDGAGAAVALGGGLEGWIASQSGRLVAADGETAKEAADRLVPPLPLFWLKSYERVVSQKYDEAEMQGFLQGVRDILAAAKAAPVKRVVCKPGDGVSVGEALMRLFVRHPDIIHEMLFCVLLSDSKVKALANCVLTSPENGFARSCRADKKTPRDAENVIFTALKGVGKHWHAMEPELAFLAFKNGLAQLFGTQIHATYDQFQEVKRAVRRGELDLDTVLARLRLAGLPESLLAAVASFDSLVYHRYKHVYLPLHRHMRRHLFTAARANRARALDAVESFVQRAMAMGGGGDGDGGSPTPDSVPAGPQDSDTKDDQAPE